MKKLICLKLVTIFSVFLLYGQVIEITEVKENWEKYEYSYTAYLNTQTKNPDVVIWTLTKDEAEKSEASKLKRETQFRPVGKHSASPRDYIKATIPGNKGIYSADKGHMCPANDRDFDSIKAAGTYLMCNICPQSSRLNRGSWKAVELQTHKYAKTFGRVAIACGPIYNALSIQKIGNNRVWLPTHFFKIIAYLKDKTLFTVCKIFDQDGNVFSSSIKEIEDLTDLHFTIYANS